MSERSNIDPEEREQLDSRAEVDPQGGAIRGDVQDKPQANSWESAKIDLAEERDVRLEQMRAGKRPATAADEAWHGEVIARTPEEFTG
ncbi:MAG: hypothetical protein M3P24_01935, partial [Gemmatimonadota bacterium]|nr:hypothetical protein [Gemmatimonadota bacterium]